MTEDIIDQMVDPEDEREMVTYSKHLTPDDWGDPKPTSKALIIGLALLLLFFFIGMSAGIFIGYRFL